MLYFLYGQDSYRAHEKLEAIKNKYIDASLGDTNLVILDAKDKLLDAEDKLLDIDQVTRELLAFPFLAKHRLVVIKNLLKGSKNLQSEMEKLILKIPDTTHLVIYENDLPDRRLALFKKLVKFGSTQEFKPLDGFSLQTWVEQKCLSLNSSMDRAAIEKLVSYVGNDLWRLNNEIIKLTNFTFQKITKEDIEILITPKIVSEIFVFLDYLARRDVENSSKELNKLLASKVNELYILTMIVYQFRNILVVRDLLDRNLSEREIIIESKLRPFVLGKIIPIAKTYQLSTLKRIYQKLLDYDLKMKSGKIESKAAISMLIFEICKEG